MSTQLDNNNDALSGSLFVGGNSPPVNSAVRPRAVARR